DLSASQRNLRGRGQSVVARTSLSSRQQVVDLRFTEPRFLDRNLSAGVDLFATKQDFEEFTGFTSETIGGGVRVAFPLTDRMQLGLSYRLQADDVNIADRNIIIDSAGTLLRSFTQTAGQSTPDDLTDDVYRAPEAGDVGPGEFLVDICDPAYTLRDSICRSERNDISSIVGYNFLWDQTNDPISPTRGFDFRFSQDIAGLGGDVQYIRTETNATFYRGIWRDVVASARLAGGYVFPLDSEEGVRINNRFFRGGNSFRGFDVAGLGPREILRIFDPNTGEVIETRRLNSLGGNAYYQGTFELTVPNFLPEEYGIKSALFVDVGALGILEDVDKGVPVFITDPSALGVSGVQAVRIPKDAASLRASAGLSVFWDSPFGPIRFDFSQILRKEEYDRTESFRFSTSTNF
ncbi:MAG: BamA/TamA family outer membrane protein, partial [Hyphomonas sp.]|nr:BamA/TamA family outer membrane protein [Hyphomonas sp.]